LGSTILLIVLTSLAGGVVLVSVTGARRTDTAMARFLKEFRPDDGELAAESDADAAAIAAWPEVAASGRQSYVLLVPELRGSVLGAINFFVAGDHRTYRDIDRLHVARGRMFDYDRADEIVLDEQALKVARLRVGSHVTVRAFTSEQNEEILNSAFGHTPAPRGPKARLRVVGVVRRPQDMNLGVEADENMALGDAYGYLPPAFLRTPAGRLAAFASEGIAQLRLRPGTSPESFARAVAARPVAAGFDAVPQDKLAAATAQRSIRIQALALLVFGVLAAVAATLIVGQTLSRQVQLDGDRDGVLRALGFTRLQRIGVAIAHAGVVAVIGAAGALAVALALSPLTPIGIGRRAELHPGFEANVAILACGAIGLVVAIVSRAAVPAWRATGPARRDAVGRRGRPAEIAARAGLPAEAVAGVNFASESGQGALSPQRTALVGVVVSVMGIVAALSFLSSLDALAGDTVRQGWNWDVVVGNPNAQLNAADEYTQRLASDASVVADATVSETTLRIAGRFVPVLGWQKSKGDVSPVVLEGRAPASPHEIALATETMRRAGVHIGDPVTIDAGRSRTRTRVVGRVLMPGAAQLDFNVEFSLDRGAVMTQDGIADLLGESAPPPRLAVLRFAPGSSRTSTVRHLRATFGRILLTEGHDVDVENLNRVRQLPLLLALLLAVIGVGSLAHTLLTSVRRKHRELAVLKTLGFVRRQVAAAVAFYAIALVVVGTVVGVPLGVALGRSAWAIVARQAVGTEPAPIVPIAAVSFVVVGALLITNLLAAWPAWSAGRVRPAAAFRVE
jgi:ABC-type lipoprotein release transport system permease subunit